MRLRVGRSVHPDTARAASEAVNAALAASTRPAFMVVFATPDCEPDEVARAVRERAAGVPWIGCTTLALLVGEEVLPHGVAVGIVEGADVRVGIGAEALVRDGGRRAGHLAAARALEGMPDPVGRRTRAMIILFDGLAANPAEVLRGAAEVAGAGVAWAGGGTGQNAMDGPGVQYANGTVHTHSVVVAAIDFPTRVGTGVQHGWRAYGPTAVVTRVKWPVIVELDYQPAFEIYRQIAAERGEVVRRETFRTFALTHPLGIPQPDGQYLIREPIDVDEQGGLRCAEVPDGALVRFMEGSLADVIQAAGAAAAMARQDAGTTPLGGAFVFDCVSRYFLFREQLREEIAACASMLGQGVPLLGCLTTGEVAAFGGQVPQFHNESAVVLALPSAGRKAG